LCGFNQPAFTLTRGGKCALREQVGHLFWFRRKEGTGDVLGCGALRRGGGDTNNATRRAGIHQSGFNQFKGLAPIDGNLKLALIVRPSKTYSKIVIRRSKTIVSKRKGY